MQGTELLAVNRLNGMMQALRDIRELPAQLVFSNRTPFVPATDGEIMGRETKNVIIADVIPDDQKARIVSAGKITLEQVHIPNIKLGKLITQAMLEMLQRINAGGGVPNDMGIFTNYTRNQMDGLLLGIRQSVELMLVGMALDTYSYNNLGVQITNVSWGMPSDLKVTPGVLWSTPATATPVADIQTMQALGREKYGVEYNRATMTSVNFRRLIATTEFREKATLYSQLVFPTAATFPIADMQTMLNIAGRLLNVQLELYDSQYTFQGLDGAETRTKFLPDNKVILSSTVDDNDRSASDFANAIVTESIISGLPGVTVIGGALPGGPQQGPIGYATGQPDLNPPNVTLWGVQRGFPRKHRLQSTAVLTTA